MKIVVNPNEKAIVYINSVLNKIYDPGVYRFFALFKSVQVFDLPTVEKLCMVSNQEILTKDNIALRLSFSFQYKISDPKTLSENFTLQSSQPYLISSLEFTISNILKVEIRKIISNFSVFELNEKRVLLFEGIIDSAKKELSKIGIELANVKLMDLSFPKNIQEIFAKLVESKIRAQADLENARTQVATARTLKNAAELMKADENIKFLQFLETLSKIASKGNHTFVVGTEHFKIEK